MTYLDTDRQTLADLSIVEGVAVKQQPIILQEK